MSNRLPFVRNLKHIDNVFSAVAGPKIPNPFMTRKNTTEATFNGEIERELRDRNMVEEVSFKHESSREEVMRHIDSMRRTELYPQPPENCNQDCQLKGICVQWNLY